jgi:hypothetical protein
MKRLFLLMIVMLLIGGCYCQEKDNDEPPYPKNIITGWKYREEKGVGILGDFVLRKGESTNNGEVKIKVADLIPAEPCADLGTTQAKKRAKIQFIRMSDNKVVCEGTFPGNFCSDGELDEFWVNRIGIMNINIKDQWVHFILTGAEKEKESQKPNTTR